MTEICVTNIIPTYNSIAPLFDSFYQFGDSLVLPFQITLPDPMWPDITSPAQYIQATITEMINSQMSGMFLALFDPILGFLSLNLEDILPDIPGFPGFNLINLIDGEIDDLIALVQVPSFDFSLIELLPDPIYPGLTIPSWDALVAVQTAINQYYQIITEVITDLVNQIADILELATLSIPTFPTLDEIMDLLPPFPTLEDLFDITIPGFSFVLAMPVPLVPGFNAPSFDFLSGLRNLFAGLSSEVESLIVDFVDSLPLSFDYPLFCIEVSVLP